MKTVWRRVAGLAALAGVAVALLLLLGMILLSVRIVADQDVSIERGSLPVPSLVAPVMFRTMQPPAQAWASLQQEPDQPAAADFVLDKKVMLQSDWNQTQSCAGAVDALTVYYSTTVTYCYIFTNIGSTTFVTHTFTDDKLGSMSFNQNVVPNGQIGFVGLPPYGLLQDTTNTATWTATDQNGTTVERTDRVTVKVVMPLNGHVFVDVNGDGIRNPSETGGVGGVDVRLESRPPDQDKARQTRSSPSGYFQFTDAVAGPYTVSVTVPAGYVATSPSAAPVTLVFGVSKYVSFGLQAVVSTPTPTVTITPNVTQTVTATPSKTPTETPPASPTPTETPSGSRVYLPLIIHVAPGALPPLAPTLMSVEAPGDRITYTLSWTPVYGTQRYELQQARDPDFLGPIEVVYDGDTTTYTVRSSGIGTLYYRVLARNLVGASSWSETQSVYVSWETEPNDLLTGANDGLASGQEIHALPDDSNDFFKLTTTEVGLISAHVDGVSGEGVRVSLYHDNIGNLLAADASAPYQVSTYGEAGDYYIRVFVEAGHTATVPYRLTATFK